jgi:two-component system, NarL family, sensor kinase
MCHTPPLTPIERCLPRSSMLQSSHITICKEISDLAMTFETDAEKLQRRNHELSILNAIAQALNRETNLEQALRTTLAHVARLCHLQTGWIWLIDEKSSDPYLAVVQHMPPALSEHPHRMNGQTYCHCLDTYQKGDMSGAANVNIITCTRLKGLVDGTDGLRYHASVPLYAHGKKLGMLNVASKDWREVSEDELQLLYTVGDMLSIAIERARLFSRSMEAGAAEERTRLAREIHDTLAQGLTAITLQLETADALLEVNDPAPRARQAVQQALSLTRQNLEDARRSVLNLRAAPLENQSLTEALEALARDYAARWNLQIEFTAHTISPLAAHLETGIYRIAQEALANAVRHAQATRLRVVLRTTADSASLVVEDDGIGFDPKRVATGRYGLIGMNERARLLGGTLDLCTSPDKGTLIEFRWQKHHD